MRKLLPPLAALSLVALLLLAPTAGAEGKKVTSASTAGTHGKKVTVDIKNFAFKPPHVTVAPGTTVKWVNRDKAPHTATSTQPRGAFDSGKLKQGQSYAFKFKHPGTYKYYGKIHPDMKGTVTVRRGG
jgi:plastocyanin